MKTGMRWVSVGVAVVLGLSLAGGASAQTYTWTNAIGGVQSWSTAANWTGGTPAAGGGANYQLIFNNSAANNTADNDLAGSFALNLLRFQSGAIALTGGTLVFTNNGGTLPVLTNASGAARTIANDVVFGANVNLGGNSMNSALKLTGTVGLGGATRNVSVAHVGYTPTYVTVSGTAENGGLNKIGNGTLILGGVNTYALGTRVGAGMLRFDSLASIGGSGANVTNAGGAIGINFAGFMNAVTTRVAQISKGSLAVSAANASEALDFRAPLFANAHLGAVTGVVVYALENHTPYIHAAAAGSNLWRFGGGGGRLVITNAIAGSDAVTIGGGGNFGGVILAGTNSYTGPTTIQDGMLLIVSNAAPEGVPSTALGATSRIVLSNGTLSVANVIITNPVFVTGGGNNQQNNGAAFQFWGGTTNEMRAPIAYTAGASVKVNAGGGAGLHIIGGGVESPNNTSVSFYSDIGGNPFVFTNNPIRIGTGWLTGKDMHIGVQDNVVGGVNVQWGNRMLLTVDDAFVGAIGLNIGTAGNNNQNWVDLNGHNLTVRSLTAIGTDSNRQYVGGSAGSLLTFTNGAGARSIYAGYFTNAVNLVKTGEGTLELRGTNAHTGTTTVQGGTLLVPVEQGIGSSAVTVSGGTLLVTNMNALGAGATLAVAGGAIGATYGIDQTIIDDAYTKIGGAPSAYALGANSASAIDFSDPFRPDLLGSFLGAAPIGPMTFSGSVAWGSTNVRLGGGGGTLTYTPAIGAGTNLLIGPAGGDAASRVVLLAANGHDRNLLQSGSLCITNDSALGAVPFSPGDTNILMTGGGLLAVSNDVTLAANRDVVLGAGGGALGADAGRTLTVPGSVDGAGALMKTGNGTVVLGGVNSYTGGTVIAGGTLVVAADNGLGADGDGAAVGAVTFAGGSLRVNGTWTWKNRAVTLLQGVGGFDVPTNQTLTVTNAITGAGGLLKTGTGRLNLHAASDYSGGTTIAGVNGTANNSKIYAYDSAALGGGTIVLTNGGQLYLVGGLSMTNDLVTYGGDFSTSYSGTLNSDSGSNVWGGRLTVTQATARISVRNGSTLIFTNGISGPNSINFAVYSGSVVIANQPIVSSGVDLFYFSGPGGGLGGIPGTNYLNVAGNVWAQARIWQNGRLVMGAENALPAGGSLTVGDPAFLSAGTLDLNGYSQSIGNLYSGTNFNASVITNTSLTPATLTVNQTADWDFLGTIGGSVGFVKNGAATMTLAVPNTHSNGTTVGGGTLRITNETALGASGGPLTLAGGGALQTTASMTLDNRAVALGAGGGAFNVDAGTLFTVTNDVVGAYPLQKNGAGDLVLGGVTDTSNLWVNAGSLLNAGAMTVIGGGAGSGDGFRIYNAAIVTNAGSLNMPSGKLQFYTNGRLVNQGPITNGYAFVMSEYTTSGHTIMDNLAGGSLVMPAGTMYIGLYYDGTFNNEGEVLQNGNIAIGPPSWTSTTYGSNSVGTLNINGGLFNFTGGGSFQIGGGVGCSPGTGVVNLAGGVLALNKGITKGNSPDVYGFFNFNGGTLSGTVNNVTLLGTGLSAVTVQGGGAKVSLADGITNTISAAMQNGGGGGGLTKEGGGVLRLTGANLYTGTTRVMAGVLDLTGGGTVDNSATLQIDAGATLRATTLNLKSGQTLKGNGAVSGGLIAESGATVAPGASPGTLTADGAWTMQSGSTFSVELNGLAEGTQYDQLVFTGGSLALNDPDLEVLLNFAPVYGNSFAIITGLTGYNPAVDGIFNGMPDESTFLAGGKEFRIDYNATEITLTVVPEPFAAGLLGLSGVCAWFFRRRLRR